MLHIVEPYADGPIRFHQTTVLSENATEEAAFAKLERMTERLWQFQHFRRAVSVGRRRWRTSAGSRTLR
jgi:hypothetical protein